MPQLTSTRDDVDESLDVTRGILNAIPISLALWGLIGTVVLMLVRP
ncbi:hypothetical protein [Microbacterium lacticum]|nr:hypothetical protein [Microbacterium lacticum]